MSTSLENLEMPVKILSQFNTTISNDSAKTKTKTCQTDCETKKISLCCLDFYPYFNTFKSFSY